VDWGQRKRNRNVTSKRSPAMSYHSEGTMTVVNDEGKTYTYKVENFGMHMVLTGKDGEFHLIEGKPPELIKKLQEEIGDLSSNIKEKKETLKRLQQWKKVSLNA
jgi:hypothetical protein